MLSITEERLSDIWALNVMFLNLCRNKELSMLLGVPGEFSTEVDKLSSDQLDEVARTDTLLFSAENFPSGEILGNLPMQVEAFLQQLGLTFRDFAREDMGITASKFGLTKECCQEVLRVRLDDARNFFLHRPAKIRAMGTTQFRILSGLPGQSERTQYAVMAANSRW